MMNITLSDCKKTILDEPEMFIGLKDHIVRDCLKRLPSNLHVLNQVATESLYLKRHGHRERYSIMCIIEKLRWDSLFSEEGEYKLNNNHGPVYGRLVMALIPELKGLFKTKKGN